MWPIEPRLAERVYGPSELIHVQASTLARIDLLGSLLDGPRARRAFLLRAVMAPPWSVRVEDRAPVSLVALARGDAWVVPDAGRPTRLGAGDVLVVRGPDAYRLADDPSTPAQVVVHPGQRCTTLHGVDLADAMGMGVRTWGNDPAGTVTMLVGTYEHCGDTGLRVLQALPPLAVLRAGEVDSPIVELLAAEIGRDDPGQDAVLDRLLDLVLVACLRAWLARPGVGPGWYRAHADDVVGPALRLLQHQPAQQWTVAALAERVGVSRAAFARRFRELVGEPPMAFLTSWRLALAADLLRDTDRTIGAIASEVGYGSAFALSTAFKRRYGRSPTQHRTPAPAAR